MSDWTDNPFGSDDNPFGDPSVTSATATVPEYNPFEKTESTPAAAPEPAAAASASPFQSNNNANVSAGAAAFGKQKEQPSSNEPSWAKKREEPAKPAPAPAPAPRAAPQPAPVTQDAFEQRQREEEYRRRDEEAQVKADPHRKPNFPPFPKIMQFGPFVPCYYINVKAEIPLHGRKIVTICLYLWKLHAITLFWNFIACLAALSGNAKGTSVSCALSAAYFLVFAPCSYHCWAYQLYHAMRKDSSVRFGWFFLVMSFQELMCIFFALGIEGTGAAGIIVASTTVKTNEPAGIMIFTAAILWILIGLIGLFTMHRVLMIYRSTGGSIDKATGEVISNAASNKGVREGLASAATNAYGGP